jgi:hypothetical protein
MAKQTNTVVDAERTLEVLQDKRAKLVERGAALDQQRRDAAFDAHTGNAAQRKVLDEINAESAIFSSELEGLDAAIAVGKSRLSAARENEAKAADKAAAKEARKICAQFVAVAERLDALGAEFNATAKELESLGRLLDIRGFPKPQRASLCALSTHTFLRGLPAQWRRSSLANFRVLSYPEKHTFADVVKAQVSNILSNVAQRLGEKENTDAAA